MSLLSQISRDDFNGVGPSAPPGNFQWYHLTLTAYGAWLYGDARGFRTRHHRQHIDGDYKHRPPDGKYAHLQRRSQLMLKQRPVALD